MTIRNLEPLLHPRTIAVIGGSDRSGTLGAAILDNLVEGGFNGLIEAVNLHPIVRPGIACASSVETLARTPDLAIVATPAATVPQVIDALGKRGCRVAVVISSGVHEDPALRQAMLDAAEPHLLRIVGPNCLGVLMPHVGLNASFAASPAAPGRLALISQSGALVTAMLDWATDRRVGFSGIVSAGDMSDVDLGDLIDLFAADRHTAAILLYIEGVTNPAKFMSAARAAARDKPVIAIKAGRTKGAGRAALSHTGAITGSYDVAAAAFRRAGIVTVETLSEMFDAAEVLARPPAIAGNRVAIVTNGGGPGILAEDALPGAGAVLADLGAATIDRIGTALGHGWSRANPVDLGGDVTAAAFAEAVTAASADPDVDAVLAINCPTAIGDGAATAAALAEVLPERPRVPVIGCWLGPRHAAAARDACARRDVALFDTIEGAVGGVRDLLAAREAQAILRRTPPLRPIAEADRSRARAMLVGARSEHRQVLNAVEAKSVLAAYGIPTAPARFARTIGGIEAACADLAAPYVVKIVSPQISHKADVGGVVTGLVTPLDAVTAAEAVSARIAREHPDASILGFEIEPMIVRPHARELLVGIARDATFGPYLVVGAGGTAVEVLRDRAIGLPPLDAALARDMIDRTRVSRLLAAYRQVPAANVDAVVAVLEAVSSMIVDFPEIAELDINPLIVDPDGVIALDARIRLDAPVLPVIRPVPVQWTADLETRSKLRMHVRPVLPTDAEALAEFFHHVTPEDLRFRFLSAIRDVGPDRIAAMTQIDYRRTMTFLAFAGETLIASATLAADPDLKHAEVAISVHRDFKNRGASWTLLEHVLRYARAEGIETVESVESADNRAALSLEHEMGFREVRGEGDSREMTVRKWLTEEAAAE
ncbi:bifunctional acetate--CoA ligase family protein/GNAT family N-acetyltransferase [Hephaestia mangrovi]|uniref:bifunctional acetate--CoA ligase family protein/GNAT family N-acetyltransferase n=1 Tax=Hephaestia mangrovi TaxID=2873268 RepID=UPI001CA64BB4|nr:bifunctional acetate--CoA ligase family protein/GNAT family N-acetyltransferase [Hephaestia mangrovi]MBY8829344.1 bifunctional acetate--CoA ligase family protein/GNAT family N-acetyltransferase [Hephaestia mangrovi]